MKKILAMLLALVMVLGLVACGSTTATTDTASTDAAADGTSTETADSSEGLHCAYALSAEPTTFDQTMVTISQDVVLGEVMQEGLYKANADGGYDLGLAESVDISDDGLTYTYHLRDTAWSNGTPVTAQDFEFAFKRLANPDTGAEGAWMLELTGIHNAADIMYNGADVDTLGVKAIDDKTLELDLDYPVSYMSSLLRFPVFAPVNQAYFEEKGDQFGQSVDAIITCGAFKIVEWEPGGTTVVLNKNEYYYDADSVQVTEMTFIAIKDTQAAVMAFENGEIDAATISGEYYTQYEGTDKIDSFPVATIRYISCNIDKNEDLANLNLRKALAYGINKISIVDDILKNGSQVANYMVPTNFAVDETGKTFRESANATYLEYDLAAAQEYLAKAKEELGKDTFEFELLYDDTDEMKNVAQFVKDDIETNLPGITITLQAQPKASRVQLMKDGDYDLAMPTWGADYQDATTFLDLWKSTNSNNFGKWVNEEYDALVNAAEGEDAADHDARLQDLIEAEAVLLDQVPVIPVYQSSKASLMNPNISVPHSASDDYVWRLATAK